MCLPCISIGLVMEKTMIDKKELKKAYKENMPPIGVYQIENRVDGKLFVGASKNLQGRINRHMFQLRMGTHDDRELQADFTRHGEENFSFTILDTIDPKEGPDHDYTDDLNTLEDMWLDKLQPFDGRGYNVRKS